ncbi:unnamed protein product, partial [Didymodactylos carnosus]
MACCFIVIVCGYDFGQHYSRIRIFEYESYSDVKFLKFKIYGPTTLANWTVNIQSEGKCNGYQANVHFDLQYGTYPLINPHNETYPSSYITTRHDLKLTTFNKSQSSQLIQIENPLVGPWFALIFVDKQIIDIKPKILTTQCNYYLTSWLDYQNTPNIVMITPNVQVEINLTNVSSAYAG